MAELILESKPRELEKNLLKDLKKFRVKISMIKPYETVDFWVKKPDKNNVLEVFLCELLGLDSSEFFKVEVSES
jgi:hypothetical protein